MYFKPRERSMNIKLLSSRHYIVLIHGIKVNLIRRCNILISIRSSSPGPIVTHCVSKQIALSIKSTTDHRHFATGKRFKSLLAVLIPKVQRTIRTHRSEGAGSIEGDIIHGVDFVRIHSPVAFESKIPRRHALIEVLYRDSTLNGPNGKSLIVSK